ncbi:MAG: hypothetical protein ACOYVG_16320 [Bacteroidota bacterium]
MKTFLLLLLFSSAFQSFGQLTKNNWLVGGSGSLFSYNEKYTYPTINGTAKYTSIDLSASVGYFFIDKFSGGLRPYLSIYKGSSSGGGSANNLKLAIGPFVRYYFLKEDKQFNILTDASYQIGINQEKNGGQPKGKFNTFLLMTGAEIFFNSSVGLEFLIGYKHQIASYDNSPSAYTSDKKGFQTSIGFQFHLEK